MTLYWDALLLCPPDEVREELKRLYDAMPIAEMSQYLGVSRAALCKKLKDFNVPFRPRGGPHPRMKPEDLPKNLMNMSTAQIVELTGYSPAYARKLRQNDRRKYEQKKTPQQQGLPSDPAREDSEPHETSDEGIPPEGEET